MPSALRIPFHIDSAPTPLFSATCGVSASVMALAVPIVVELHELGPGDIAGDGVTRPVRITS